MSGDTCDTCERWEALAPLTVLGECSVTGTRMLCGARETCDQYTPDLAALANRYMQAGATPVQAAAALAKRGAMNATSYSVKIDTAIKRRGTTYTISQWSRVLGCAGSAVHGLLVRHCPDGYLVREGSICERSLRVHPIPEARVPVLDAVCVMTAGGPVTMTREEWADALWTVPNGVYQRLMSVQKLTRCNVRVSGGAEITVEPTYWMRWHGVEVGP